jgi:hypothetical protein
MKEPRKEPMPDLEQRTFMRIHRLTKGGFTRPSMLNGLGIEPNSRLAVIFLWASYFILYWDRKDEKGERNEKNS